MIGTEQVLKILEGNPTVTVPKGGQIIAEGSAGDSMFVIKTGMVELLANGQLLDVLEPGNLVGEMALIDGENRSASAHATTDCELIPIDLDCFRRMVGEEPDFALYTMQVLARRVRRMNMVISA